MSKQWLLIGQPEWLHVPVLARGTPSSFESRIGMGDNPDLSKQIGGEAARWLAANATGQYEFRWTRNHLPSSNFLYAKWLIMIDEGLAGKFLAKYPAIDVANRYRKLESRAEKIRNEIAMRMDGGGFDLSRQPPDHRRSIAERYIRLDTKLNDLVGERHLIDRALGVIPGWMGNVSG